MIVSPHFIEQMHNRGLFCSITDICKDMIDASDSLLVDSHQGVMKITNQNRCYIFGYCNMKNDSSEREDRKGHFMKLFTFYYKDIEEQRKKSVYHNWQKGTRKQQTNAVAEVYKLYKKMLYLSSTEIGASK